MLLLSFRPTPMSELSINVGAVDGLDIDKNDDLSQIHDLAIAHFRKELSALRPDVNWENSVTVIKCTLPDRFYISLRPFSGNPASRTYTLTEVAVLNKPEPKHPQPESE